MSAVRPIRLAQALLLLTFSMVPLHLAESPQEFPHWVSGLGLFRIGVGLPVVLFVPGMFLVPLLLGRDVQGRGGDNGSQQLQPIWFALGAAGLTVLCHVLNLNLLRIVGAPVDWRGITALLAVEGVAGFLLTRSTLAQAEFAPISSSTKRAMAAAALTILAFALWTAPNLLRHGSWYFYNPTLNRGWDSAEKIEDLKFQWSDGVELQDGVPFTRRGRIMRLNIDNSSDSPQQVPVFLMVHGKIGTTLGLSSGDTNLGRETIASRAPLKPGGEPIERYYEWGVASVAALECGRGRPGALCQGIEVPAKGRVSLDLQILPSDQELTPRPEDTQLVGWGGMSSSDLLDDAEIRGHHHMHPFQLLNVTENIRWAAEVTSDYILPGRSVDGLSTLHQPPAWTYLYAPARELLSGQGGASAGLFLAILLGIVMVGLQGIDENGGSLSTPLGIVLGLMAIQHGQLMIDDGSLNFPDNLYALALVASVVTLVSGRTRLFVLWAFLASILRYPGAVVVGLAGVSLLVVDSRRRRAILEGLVRFSLAIALFCGVFLLVGLKFRLLDGWFFALYFETVPEHFHNTDGALPLLRRPVEFLRILAILAGGLLVLAVPFRGVLSRVALGTAVLYTPLLAFIDHFSNHYFLPLIGLIALSAASSVSLIENNETRARCGLALAGIAAFLYFGATMSGLLGG